MVNKGSGFGQGKKKSRWSLTRKPTEQEQQAANEEVRRWRFGGTSRSPGGKKRYYDPSKKAKPKDNW